MSGCAHQWRGIEAATASQFSWPTCPRNTALDRAGEAVRGCIDLIRRIDTGEQSTGLGSSKPAAHKFSAVSQEARPVCGSDPGGPLGPAGRPRGPHSA